MDPSFPFDALLIVSFGGPEGPDDVLPFLENVLRGKNVPHERMLTVAEHYFHFAGVSPINGQNRALVAALEQQLALRGPQLPIFFGNRNWHPLLQDTLSDMAKQGIRRTLAFFTSAFSSYSGCRQYWENIAAAQAAVGPAAPHVDKLRAFYNHPGFIEAMADRVSTALLEIPSERRDAAQLIFTAHSIPQAMADLCRYEVQLREASSLTAGEARHKNWELAYQSRSGPPTQPWLEPDICDALRSAKKRSVRDVVVVPIGFISDHMEVIYDLDTEAAAVAREIGLNMIRAGTAGTHPAFVRMIHELILERVEPGTPRRSLGNLGPSHDACEANCCPSGRPG